MRAPVHDKSKHKGSILLFRNDEDAQAAAALAQPPARGDPLNSRFCESLSLRTRVDVRVSASCCAMAARQQNALHQARLQV